MAKLERGNTVSLNANGLSDWLPLTGGKHNVSLTSTAWGGATATLVYSHDGLDAGECVMQFSGADAAATQNRVFSVEGRGYIGFRLASQAGDAKVLTIV